MKQISIELENRPNQLTRVLGLLAARDVELRALTVGHTISKTDKGLVKMIVNKLDTAVAALEESGVEPMVEEVLVTPVEDHAGGLHAILEVLARANLNIEHMYTFVSRVEGKALSVFTFDDALRAAKVLRSAGVRLIGTDSPDKLEEYALGDLWDLDVAW